MSEDHTNLIFQKQANIGTFFWATVYSLVAIMVFNGFSQEVIYDRQYD